jgi:hypothetical protein
MNILAPSPKASLWSGTSEYPKIGTSINGKSTINFTSQAGLNQSSTLDGVKNLFWVGRISAPTGTGTSGCYFLLGHDIYYDWHGDLYGGKFLNQYADPGIYNASPTSLFTSDPNAVTNTTFSSVNMPTAPSVSLLSVANISGFTRYQGICYDRHNQDGGVHIGWTGDLAEVITFSTDLTTTNRQKVEGYLAWKWGLQSTLPSNHPYRNTAPSA